MILGSALEARTTKSGWAAYMRKYRAARPEIMKAIDLKKNYGLSLDTYQELFEKQKGVCAICGEPEKSKDHRTKKERLLAVDHCHVSSKIRGLLCGSCNKALGGFKDNVRLLESAIKYLQGA